MSTCSTAIWKDISDYLLIALCCLPYGVVVNQVLVPHAIVGGGLTGLCEILYFMTHGFVPIWVSTVTLNGIFLFIAILTVGWQFCARTIYAVLCMTLWLKVIPLAVTPVIANPLVAILLSAIVQGIAMGEIFLHNSSTGGTDIVAMIINKYKHWPMGRILWCLDLFIIGNAYWLPEVHSVKKVLFGLSYTLVAALTIDGTMRLAKRRTKESIGFCESESNRRAREE